MKLEAQMDCFWILSVWFSESPEVLGAGYSGGRNTELVFLAEDRIGEDRINLMEKSNLSSLMVEQREKR